MGTLNYDGFGNYMHTYTQQETHTCGGGGDYRVAAKTMFYMYTPVVAVSWIQLSVLPSPVLVVQSSNVILGNI